MADLPLKTNDSVSTLLAAILCIQFVSLCSFTSPTWSRWVTIRMNHELSGRGSDYVLLKNFGPIMSLFHF